MKCIGIIGGTFDPVHNGHLMLGKQAYMEYGLDEIWFMPSHIPPHKKDHVVTDGNSVWICCIWLWRIFLIAVCQNLRWSGTAIRIRHRHLNY